MQPIFKEKEENNSELAGCIFGRLKIIRYSRQHKTQGAMYLAICECGIIKEYRLHSLTHNMTFSCGCYNKDYHSTHGLRFSPLYSVWRCIKNRCYYKKHENYPLYGGSGVGMCNEWKTDFKSFHDWAIINGWQKGLQVDRFPNRNGNYSPENCRVSTPKQNSNNKNNNRILNILGELMTLAEAVEKYGIKTSTLFNRLKRGMSDYDATHTEIRHKKNTIKYQPIPH